MVRVVVLLVSGCVTGVVRGFGRSNAHQLASETDQPAPILVEVR